jgi:arylformamidase
MNVSREERQLIDVSHIVEHGMITYRGLPGPVIRDLLSREASRGHYAEGVEFQIGTIELVANTGTYVDAPFHRYADGADLSQLDLSSIANLNGLVVRALDQPERELGVSYFRDLDVTGKAVLVNTGWDVRWGSDRYFERNPFLTREAAQFLADSGARLVGIDSQNIDDILDLSRPVHSILLKAGIPIVEHLCNLATLPDHGFRFFAVPVKIKGMGTFPVRAFGILQ